jgi:hypothetical protein
VCGQGWLACAPKGGAGPQASCWEEIFEILDATGLSAGREVGAVRESEKVAVRAVPNNQ